MKLHISIYQPPAEVFFYHIPELKGLIVTGSSLFALTSAASMAFVWNHKEPPDDLFKNVENAVCSRLDPSWYELEPGDTAPNRITMRDVYSYGRAALRRLKIGRDKMLVDQTEAERRAEICAGCKLNMNIHGCASCFVSEMSMAGMGIDERHRTAHHDRLYACGVCKCPTMTIVHLQQSEIDLIHAGANLAYPEHCWQRKPDEA